ncbi:hypothetical protein BHM03_00041832, partial [Ensete ventricosum]
MCKIWMAIIMSNFPFSCNSEFEELEAVPTSSVIEGPLEPTTSAATPIPDVPDDALTNFFGVCFLLISFLYRTISCIFNALNIGNASNVAISGQPPLVAATVPVTSNESSTNPSVIPTVQPPPTFPASSSLMPPLETLESSSGNINRATSLVTPSFFTPLPSTLAMPQAASLTPTAPPLYPPVTMQRPYGTPLLQPFPPPAPSASLTPAPNYGPILTREKVCAALLKLVQ